MAEPSKHTSWLFLLDRKSGQKFLIDSGSEICVIPPSPTMNKSPQSNFSLFAANNTKIPAYGMVRKELNLGLRRPFIWTFIIADVSSPIIGTDFLKHFNLLIDTKKKRLVDVETSLFTSCVFSNIVQPSILTVDANISFKNILSEYPDLSNPFLISKSASHGTVHHIITTGPPVTARPRRLHPKLYDAVKVRRTQSLLNWSSEAITAFQRCKQALADAALLAHPSPSAPLALHVDASNYAIGGALHQVVDSELQPLAFFSRKLTSSEKSYSAYDRELLAIYSAIKHFRYMLEARDFTLFTDHKPLTYAFRQKVTSVLHGRSVSWISSLSSPQILYTFQDLTTYCLMFSLVFLQSPSQVKLTMTVLLRHKQTDQELHTNSIWNFLGTQKR
ncbi:RT_RNaseH_2 domain-containing protein [Trichonephila clavipes]|nr:RT_RNaseH_2 domain-containing protein [Trichonephila clavipes]